jgi:hypothetical protein
MLGGPEKVFTLPGETKISLVLNAQAMGEHLEDLARSAYWPLIPDLDLLNKPQEIWQGFERSAVTGRVALRIRVIKAVEINGRSLLMVGNASEGAFQSWTFIPTPDLKYIQRQRWGKLLYAAD